MDEPAEGERAAAAELASSPKTQSLDLARPREEPVARHSAEASPRHGHHAAAAAAAASTTTGPVAGDTPDVEEAEEARGSDSVSSRVKEFFLMAGPSAGRRRDLPPKPAAEASRHRKAIHRLSLDVRRQLKREAAEQKRAQKRSGARENQLRDLAKAWTSEILPGGAKALRSKRARQLLFKGVPSSVRGRVWPVLLGNTVCITRELHAIFLERAARAKQDARAAAEAEAEAEAEAGDGAAVFGKEGTVSLVEIDLDRTFPALSIFQSGAPLHESLREVLEAFIFYRPDIGYVQGMSYFAAMLLLYMDSYLAFVCLANIMSSSLFLSFFRMDMMALGQHFSVFKGLLAQHIPDLARHFEQLGITPEMYLIDWALTLYAKSLDLDVAARIWDVYLGEERPADFVIFRAALGLFTLLRPELLAMPFEDCIHALTHLRERAVDADALMTHIAAVPLTADRYAALMRECDPTATPKGRRRRK